MVSTTRPPSTRTTMKFIQVASVLPMDQGHFIALGLGKAMESSKHKKLQLVYGSLLCTKTYVSFYIYYTYFNK